LIDAIARHLDRSLAQSVSHADAALAVLKELERDGAAICLPAQRTKVLAVIGTTIGNRIPRRRTSRR
jgi:hypothetical protein